MIAILLAFFCLTQFFPSLFADSLGIDAVPIVEPNPWSLDIPLAFPEGLGADLQYRWSAKTTFSAFYHLPTTIRVKATIKSRKLLNREGIQIRSPNINLPARVELGPHQGLGLRLQPFASPYFLMLALETRILRVKSEIQSHLEVSDSQSRGYTNTLFQAAASTRTDQLLLRPTFGYRWSFANEIHFMTLYAGWSYPIYAHSRVRTRVHVRNLEASNPADVDANNLQDAEAQQGQVIHHKLKSELHKFEKLPLPVFGISFGRYF